MKQKQNMPSTLSAELPPSIPWQSRCRGKRQGREPVWWTDPVHMSARFRTADLRIRLPERQWPNSNALPGRRILRTRTPLGYSGYGGVNQVSPVAASWASEFAPSNRGESTESKFPSSAPEHITKKRKLSTRIGPIGVSPEGRSTRLDVSHPAPAYRVRPPDDERRIPLGPVPGGLARPRRGLQEPTLQRQHWPGEPSRAGLPLP
jgi:hypothetical protein